MELLTIGNKKWAVGLEWEILPGDGTVAQEAKDVAEKTGLKYGVLVDYDSNFSIGLTQKNTKLPSAALYLALANQDFRENNADTTDYPDWVVIEDVGDDKYWMGVIKSGLPSPQYDMLLSLAEVKEKIKNPRLVFLLSGMVALIVVIVLIAPIIGQTAQVSYPVNPAYGNSVDIGLVLFTKYLVPFEVAAVMLLVAMIGGIVLAGKKMN